MRLRVAVGCQGGGSHTAFTAGALGRLLRADVEVVGLSGTSGGAICALLAWDALLRGDPPSADAGLRGFWRDIAARGWERLGNDWLVAAYRLLGEVASPELNPYLLPAWGQARLRAALERRVDFDGLAARVTPASPLLVVSAVDVLSGEFHVFRNEQVSADALLASAAIPTLFPAVRLDGRLYWDGLLSQNPPLRDLVALHPDELWIVQINPRRRDAPPTSLAAIRDRRNELTGNLSLEQELHPIETINRLLADDVIEPGHFQPLAVRRIEMGRQLDMVSKLDRAPAHIAAMLADGEARMDAMLRERGIRDR